MENELNNIEVPESEIERRKQICYNCENLHINLNDDECCAKCACPIEMLIKNKSLKACPLNKWASQELSNFEIKE